MARDLTSELPSAETPPADAHEAARLAHVHPPDWVNPAPRARYDLVVIGAGTAGLVAAAGAAGLGAKVALVERHLMGGDCLNVGCVPSKALLRAGRGVAALRRAEEVGATAARVEVNFGVAMERLRRLRARIAPVDGAPRFRELGVDVFFGSAKFVDRASVEVGGQRLRFKRACLATGGRPALPPIPGLAESGCLTNETVFNLTTLPKRLVIIGGGPIGCELAQAFARLGSRVTLFEAGPRLLPHDDPEAAAVVRSALERDSVQVLCNAKIERVVRVGEQVGVAFAGLMSGLSPVTAESLLVAAGRAPNVEGLQLEQAGVETGAQGIRVDDRLRTSNARIFAAGDVASRFRFTHAADAQARLVLQNAFFFGRRRASRLVVPWATYTSPEVAHVGRTAEGAAREGLPVDTFRVGFEEVDRAILDGDEQGFVKVHVRRGGDEIVGATVVGPDAGDLIAPVVLAMTHGLGISALGATILPYPTNSLALKRAGDLARRRSLTPFAARVLRFLIGLAR